jgi:hypothetical protein
LYLEYRWFCFELYLFLSEASLIGFFVIALG